MYLSAGLEAIEDTFFAKVNIILKINNFLHYTESIEVKSMVDKAKNLLITMEKKVFTQCPYGVEISVLTAWTASRTSICYLKTKFEQLSARQSKKHL